MSFNPDNAVPEPSFNPDNAEPDAGPPVREVLRQVVKTKPDTAAEVERLAKRYPAPYEVIERNVDDFQMFDAAEGIAAQLKQSPLLENAIRRNPRLGALAHDDIGRLTEMEQAVRTYGEWKAWNGPEPTVANIATGLARAIPQAGRAIRASLDAQMVDFLEWVGLVEVSPVERADRARKLAQATGAADFTRPDFESTTGQAIYGGVESTLRMIPGLAATIATRSPTPMLAAAGVQTQAEAYGKYRTRGGTPSEAFVGASAEGAIEVATELIPAKFLTERLGRAGVGEFVAGLLAREIPGEQIATLLQDAVDTAVANPDKTWSQYLAERPEAAYSTLVSTLTQSALMGGVSAAVNRLASGEAEAQAAQQNANALQDLLKAAGSSALRERSPEQFRALMGEMTDGKVYVDANVLNQLPEEVLNQLPESVRAQIPDEAAKSGTVEIPVADVLTVAPGTPLEKVIVENARMTPDGLSRADAVAAGDKAEVLRQEAERVIQQAQDQEVARAEYETVRSMYAEQIAATGRHSRAVAQQMGDWIASFYTAYGSRVGMTASQFQQRYPLRVLGAPSATASGPVMDNAQLEQVAPEALAEAAALEAEARQIQLAVRARTKAERDAGAEQISDATLAANRADGDRAFALLVRAQELRRPPVVVRERAAPRWFNDMGDAQRTAVDGLPEWDGADGFSLRRGGENAEDDIYTSAESNFTDSEVVPGVRSVPLEKLGDLGGYDDAREQQRIAALADRMREDKEITPIFVGVDATGDLFIMEGQHRARAFKALGMQSIPAKIVVDFSDGRYEQRPVLDQGKPTVYRGRMSKGPLRMTGGVTYFTDSRSAAQSYIDTRASEDYDATDANVMEATLDLKNPASADDIRRVAEEQGIDPLHSDYPVAYLDATPALVEALKAAGYDGAVGVDGRPDTGEEITAYAVFSPDAVRPPRAPALEQSAGPGTPAFAAQVAAAAPDILGHYKVARGLALPKSAKLWRGETSTTGTHSAVYGRGLYVTADKTQAREFAGQGGTLREMSAVDLPQNPLRFDSINDYQVWEQDARERLGLKRASEFSAKVKDVADFVRALDPSVDGVQIGKGKDAFFVKYPPRAQSAIGNRGTFDPQNPSILEQSAFHGTPHRGIEKFTTDKIGTGEGFQAFGWGLYFTDKRGIAEWYREKLTEKNAATGVVTEVNGQPLKDYLAGVEVLHPLVRAKVSSALRDKRSVVEAKAAAESERAKFEGSNPPAAEKTNAIYAEVQRVLDGMADAQITYREPDRGQLYEVELPDDENLLLWDKPLGQQPEKVRKALKDSGLAKELKDNLSDFASPMETRGKLKGENIYAYLTWKLGSDKAASERLRELGILGTNYPAGTIAGNTNTKARNYVIFSGDDVQIRNQFYQRQQAQTPRGTFNPRTLELVLNPNANLSTWFHEAGHFFLEVMADIASQPNAPAQIAEDMGTFLKWAGITGDEGVGGADSGVPLSQADQDAQREAVYKEIAADDEITDAIELWMTDGKLPDKAVNDKLLAYMRRLPPVPQDSYLTFYRGQPANAKPHPRGWASWTTNKDETRFFTDSPNSEVLTRKGVQGISLEEVALWKTRATGQRYDYGSQGEWLVLNESVFNQNGQPTAPTTQPLPKRRTPLETWNAMTLDQKRPYHERWAESIEQYVMEGKAPSVELQPLMRRFATWLKSVYGSIKQFLAARGQVAAGGSETLGQQVQAAEAVPTGKTSPITRNPIFELRDANGQRIGLTHSYATPEEALTKFNAPKPQAPATPTYTLPEQELPKRSNWKQVKGQKFTNLDEDDGFLYHVTAAPNATGIRADGLVPGQGSTFGGSYAGYSAGKVFLTERSGVSFWTEKVEQMLFHNNDNPPAVVVMRIPKDKITAPLTPDDVGTKDANARAYYSTQTLAQNPAAQQQPLNIQLNDDIRRVMDRMLATDEQIAQANEVAGLMPNEEADGTAAERLNKRSMRDLALSVKARDRAIADLRKEAKILREAIEQRVTEEVDDMPVYQAKAALDRLMAASPEHKAELAAHKEARKAAEAAARAEVKAALLAENPDVKALAKGQLLMKNKRDIDNKVDAAMIKWDQGNPKPQRITPDMTPQMESIATQYGYDSVDAMLQDIAAAGPRRDVIEGMTDQRMLEEHGDLVDERAIQQAANEAVHNEARARSLATELRAQAEMLNKREDTGETNARGARITVNALVEAAKQFGANVVSRTTIRDLRGKAWQHTAAERRAGKRWQEATAAGKTAEAVKAKQDQVLNNAAAKAALEAETKTRKLLDYLKKFDKASVREKLPVEYLDQIDKLLERIDLRVSTTGRDIDRRASLAAWIESQHAIGLDPVLPESLLEDIQLKSYKEMTYEEFVGLTESIKNIEHLGRLKSKLLAAKDKREFDAIANEWADSIRANGGKAKPVKLEPDSRVVAFFKGAWAEHRKLNSLVRQMDGGEDSGPGFRFLVQSMNERGTQEDSALEKATMALADIFAPIDKLPGGLSGDKRFIPAINNSLSRAGRLAIALNWGNTQNRQRVMDGDGWTEAQVNSILSTLSVAELQFVNEVWEHIDSYWPDVKAKQLRVSGVVEDKVEAEPFTITSAEGTVVPMRGGYYPIKYDPDRSVRAQINEAKEIAADMLRGAMLRPTTRRGHTKARVDEIKGRPIRKDLAPITQHVSQVVHDLAWHEWAIDANRLLSDPRISSAIRDHHGAETHRAMTEAVEAIVVGDLAKQTEIDKLLLMMRANVTRSIMGVSATTALLQPFGLTQSMARIGVVPVLKGAARWAGSASNMENSLAWIQGKSEFMRLRAKTFNRDLREINATIQGKWKVTKVMDAVLFYPMQKMQMIADVPTWIGMYEKALAEGRDEDTAIALADEAVLSSQGGGSTKDLAGVQRNLPFLTQFYSYFSATLNLVAEKTALTDFKNPRAVAGWVGDMALLAMIPAILPALLTYALKGGGEEDEPEEWAKKLAEWQAGYLLGMFVGLRELPTLWSPFDYGGPPAGKLINDGKRLVQQAGQGEIDDPAVLATIGFLGTALGLPTTQVIRSYKGWKAWEEGDAPATSILFGPPPKE